MARHAQITQNNKFAIFLQYLTKGMSDKVDKHKSFLKIDNMILMGMVKKSQSLQHIKFAMFLQYSKIKLEMQLIFCMQINIKVSYKLISTFWTSTERFSKCITKIILVTFIVTHINCTLIHVFFIRKQFFCLSLIFLNIKLEIRMIFLILFLNFYTLVFFNSLI